MYLKNLSNGKERKRVSFKVAKVGMRYSPKLVEAKEDENESDQVTKSHQKEDEGDRVGIQANIIDHSSALPKPGLHSFSEDQDASFSLNLFQSGFFIGKPNELLNDTPKKLHPYDSEARAFFDDIESGYIPTEISDDQSYKYVHGTLLCEIRDYRNVFFGEGDTNSSMEIHPIVQKVILQMCTLNVIKDIYSMANDSWTYNDLLEAESRILKAMRPNLDLDPKPKLDKFCEESVGKKLDLKIPCNRRKRMLYGASTIRKKLRLDPHDMPQEKLLRSQAKNEISIELQGRNKFLHQQSEVEGTLHEGIIEGTPSEVPISEVEEELVEGSTSQNMQSMKSSDLSHILDMGNDQCVLPQSQATNRLGLVNDNVTTDAIECNPMHEPISTNIINPIVDHGKKRKELQHSQISFGYTSEIVGFGPVDFLPGEESLPLKRHASYHVKDCNMNKIESFASTSRTNVTNLACFSEETFPWPSVIHDQAFETPINSKMEDSIIDRLSKVKMVTERYALNNKKQQLGDSILDRFWKVRIVAERYGLNDKKEKLTQAFKGKRYFGTTTMVAFHLMNSDALNFQDGNIVDNSNTWNLQAIFEMPEKGSIGVPIVSSNGKFAPIELHLSRNFNNNMMCEEYYPIGGGREFMSHVASQSFSTPPQTISTAMTMDDVAYLFSPIFHANQSPSMFNATSSGTSSFDPRKFLPQNKFSRCRLFSFERIQSALSMPDDFSEPLPEFASRFSSMHPNWPYIMYKPTFSHLQMQQESGLEEEPLQKEMLMGEFDDTSYIDDMLLDGDSQGLGDVGLGSSGDIFLKGSELPLNGSGGNVTPSC